ncbi:MAG: ATP-binding cassette domain-containing protein, partial [Proteobacteria bacterium]|nr:ATP-binding cassette domain-containing protein [Pseudomonadota bacterium]
MNDELLLNCTDLHAGYGRVPVLRGVSIAVRPRQFVSLIGPNGAGKSTVLKAITG